MFCLLQDLDLICFNDSMIHDDTNAAMQYLNYIKYYILYYYDTIILYMTHIIICYVHFPFISCYFTGVGSGTCT